MRHISLLLAGLAVSCGSNPSANSGAYCAEIAARYCDQQISCNRFAASHRKDCIESLRLNSCGVRANESSRGLFKLNEKLTTKCLADLKSSGCTRDGIHLLLSCLAAIEPAGASGSTCEVDAHCRDLNQRCIGVGCERSCKDAGAADQPCRPSATTAGAGTCNAGLTCDANGICSKGGKSAAACSGALPCDGDNFCDNTTVKCVALPATGQACRLAFPQCAEAAYCAGLNCVERLAVGGVCLTSNQCVVGTRCLAGTCQAFVAEKGACMTASDCAAGLTCDNVTLTCLKATRVFFEEACSSSRVCSNACNWKPASLLCS